MCNNNNKYSFVKKASELNACALKYAKDNLLDLEDAVRFMELLNSNVMRLVSKIHRVPEDQITREAAHMISAYNTILANTMMINQKKSCMLFDQTIGLEIDLSTLVR